MTTRRPHARYRHALALEPRILLDAAATTTAAEVVAATATEPGVTASPVEATITIDDASGAQSVDLFSGVSVNNDGGGDELDKLVITVDSSGSNQALLIDGSTIALATGSGTTSGNHYYYEVVSGSGSTTITITIASSDTGYTAAGAASLIDSIAYGTLDNTVTSREVTVTLASLSDEGGQSAELGISSTIAITSNINVAPVLSHDNGLEAAESFTIEQLGDDTEVVYSGDGSYAYVAGNGAVSVFSVDSSGRLSLVETLTVDGMGTATEMVISADGSSIYIIDGGSNIHVFQAAADGTLEHLSSVPSSNGTISGGLAISDDGAYVYVGTMYNDVAIFSRDSATGALTYLTRAPGESGSNSRNGVIITSGDYVYVIYTTGNHALIAYQRNSDGSLSTAATVLTGGSGYSAVDYVMAVSSDGQYLYLADPVNGTVSVYQFSGNELSLVSRLSLAQVSGIALSDDGSLLYATTGTGNIEVYAVAGNGSLNLLSTLAAGTSVGDIALSSDGHSLLVASDGSVTRYTLVQTANLGQATPIADGLTLKDSNFDVLNGGAGNYNGASITLSASVAGGSFGFADGNGLSYANGVISYNGSAIGSFTVSGGTLTVSFTADLDSATANQVLHQITYSADATPGSLITLTVGASDGSLASNTLTLTLRANSVPQVDSAAATGYSLNPATSETAYSFTLFAGLFGDADGDALTWSVSGLPAGLSFDPATRSISGAASQTGTFAITVTVTDASGASASLVLDLVVGQIANRAPVVNEDVSSTLTPATEGSGYSTTLDGSLFTDADSVYGDNLSWTVSGLPAGLLFDAATLTISGTASALGSYTITVTATDSAGASTSTELTLRVITQAEADNSAPVLGADDIDLAYTSDGNLTGFSQYVYSLELSADNNTLLVVGSSSGGHSVTPSGNSTLYVYSRDSSGKLTLIQTLVQGASDDGNDANGLEINGLDSATSAVYSADGQYVYLVGKNTSGTYTVTTLQVNADGTLSATGLSVQISDSSTVRQMLVSDDGQALYVISGNYLYAYATASDGSLTLLGSYSDSFSTANAIALADGVLYVAGGSKVIIYTVDGDGSLSYATTWSGGSTFMRSIAATDDGYVYVSRGTTGISVMHYDKSTNTATLVTTYASPAQTWGLTLSEDGSALYAGINGNTIYVFQVNADGTLTQTGTLATEGARGLRYAMSSDGASIYFGGFYNGTGLGQISTSGVAGSYTEGGISAIGSKLTLSDADYDALAAGSGNYKGATIGIVRDGGANTADSYGFTDGNGLTHADGVIYLDGAAIATFASVEGVLTVTFTADVSTATANAVLQQISYSNSSNDPGSSITLKVSVGDEYASASINVKLTVTEINDAPTLDADGKDVTYTSGGHSVKLFGDAEVSAVEASQTITALTLTVSGLVDGSSETLSLGGTTIALVAGSGTAGGFSYTVTVSGDTATISLTSSSGVSAASTAALVDSIAYANSSADPGTGTRTVTLTAIQDNGGTSNGGVNSAVLAIAATVTVGLTNTAPTVAATGASTTYVENGAASTLFSNVSLSTQEAGQAIASLTLTVSGLADGDSETLMLDGSAIALVDGSGTTASGYSYTVTLSGGTATVVIASADGIATADAAALIEGLGYANASEDPTAGSRSITLAAVQDDGGTANGGADTATPGISATVDVVAVNDAPTVSATPATVSYTASGNSAALFGDVVISTVESGQRVLDVSFTVSGLLDGASERLNIGGSSIALVEGSGTTASGLSYTVTLNGGTATVVLSSSAGLTAADAAALIQGSSYTNLSNTQSAGSRSVEVSVRDNGGTADGGVDSGALAGSATVVVVVNSAPVLGSTPDHNTLEVADSLTAISGLDDIAASALSADGAYLYVASSDGHIAIFSRNAGSGELVLLQTLDAGISAITGIAVSGDGGTVFALGDGGDSIAIFSRGADGSLTALQTLATENVTGLAVSSDGGALYVIDGNYSGLLVYTLDSGSGQYAEAQRIAASTSGAPYLFTAVAIEVVGDYVFVVTDPAADSVANTLIVYARAADGTLSSIAHVRDGGTVDLGSPVDIAVSADGGTLYVANADGISLFSFDAGSGTLNYLGSVSGLANLSAVALSSDGSTLYATSSDGSVARYQVGGDGSLTLLQTLSSADHASLAGAQAISTGADGALVVIGSGGLTSLTDGLAAEVALGYTEQGSLTLADGLTLRDADYDALASGAGNYQGAVITLVRDGGASTDDGYGLIAANGLTLADGVVSLNGQPIATFSSVGGTLTLAFTAEVSTATANLVLQQITYTNASNDPGSSVRLNLSVTDAYGASAEVTLVLEVSQINDAPVVTATGADTTYTEGGSGSALFSGSSVSTVEAGQAIASLTLTVSGLADGASETLTVDGSAIALVEGSGTTANGLDYTVTLSGGTATVLISSAAGLSAADAATLIDGITYANASSGPTEGARSVSLTAVQDNGGSADGGNDTATLAITATVTVAAVNAAPVVGGSGASATYTEGGSGSTLFSGITVSTVEAGQSIASFTLTVAGVADGANETLTVDGSSIALVAGSGTTANGLGYIVTVSNGTATVLITSASGLAAADAATLITGITYANAGNDPTEGVRTITLAAVQDTGGTASGGSDTATPAIAATVTVAAINQAPSASGNGVTADYAASGNPVALFDGIAIDTVEASQNVAGFSLTVSGMTDSAEQLVVDGSAITLSDGASGTTASGYAYTVSVSNGSATVSLSLGANGISAAAAATLVEGIAYRNTSASVSTGERTITLVSLRDTGGTANGGSDSTALSISATVDVINSAPQAGNPNYSLPQASPGASYETTLPADLFTDADGDTLAWSIGDLPEGLSFDPVTRTLSGSVASAGSYTLTVAVSDPDGASASRTLVLTVAVASDVSPHLDPGSWQPFVHSDALVSAETEAEDSSAPVASGAAPSPLPAGPSFPGLPGGDNGAVNHSPASTVLLNQLEAASREQAEQGRLALELQTADGSSSPLVVLGRSDGPVLEATRSSVSGEWRYDPAGNRHVFQLPPGLIASRSPIAAIELRMAGGGALPAGVRFDPASNTVIAAGLGGARSLSLELVVRTADGQQLTLPVQLSAQGRSAWLPARDTQTAADAAAKPAFSQQIQREAGGDLLAQARSLLQQLAGAPAPASDTAASAAPASPAQAPSTVG